MKITERLRSNLKNLPGWFTNRKIVVIESDDWGSIRMPSRAVFDKLTKAGLDLSSGDSSRYNKYDSLATNDDLTHLFDTLSSIKDASGNPCVLTAVSVVSNPDFEKIKASSFLQYHYEPFTETLKRYPNCENSFQIWREGIDKHLFVPQFHGREHLNVNAWLRSLRAGHKQTMMAFHQGMWGFVTSPNDNIKIQFQAAFDLETLSELENQKLIISEGLNIFRKLFDYRASYFVPPNGPFNNKLEQTAAEHGVHFMSTSKIQYEPQGNGRQNKVYHWLGQKNRYGQRYITRNCFFEPSKQGQDWVDTCLRDINLAFRWHKPAVISSHRVNYIGSLDPLNRINGLKQLKNLLETIVNKWPDVEFMTSNELGSLMENVS